jgi:glycosyltransferase involved in cell wall biosynthesis
MRVLWFTNTAASGEEFLEGKAVRGGWLKSLDKALKNKVELHVAFYYPKFAQKFEYNGVHYYPICKSSWKFNIIKNALLGNRIDKEDLQAYISVIENVQPDIIHIHGSENPFACIIDNVTIPVIVSIQGNCTVINHKYFSGIDQGEASLSGKNYFSLYSLLFDKSFVQKFKNSSFNSKREIRNLQNCKYVIGRTDWDRRITRIMAPQSNYYHNDEILRESFFQHEWKRLENRKLVIHSTISDALFKGFETICQTLTLLINNGIDVEWRVAGISKKSLLDKVIKRKLRNVYPAKALILLGDISEQHLIEKLLEADIYVMPSHIENSSNSLCEAMLLGMPCITTLAGGSSTILKDKEEGLVIQDGDPWSMAGAILELVNSPETAAMYGQNARRKATVRHNPASIVDNLMLIYNSLLGVSN